MGGGAGHGGDPRVTPPRAHPVGGGGARHAPAGPWRCSPSRPTPRGPRRTRPAAVTCAPPRPTGARRGDVSAPPAFNPWRSRGPAPGPTRGQGRTHTRACTGPGLLPNARAGVSAAPEPGAAGTWLRGFPPRAGAQQDPSPAPAPPFPPRGSGTHLPLGCGSWRMPPPWQLAAAVGRGWGCRQNRHPRQPAPPYTRLLLTRC